MPAVFLSYRRADSQAITALLFDYLVNQFGATHVFRDVDSIPFGLDFRQVLRDELAYCDVFLAVVGPSWLQQADKAGRRRLGLEDDFVRLEIEAAIDRRVPIYVVLVGTAERLRASLLPPSLEALARCPAIVVRAGINFRDDAAALANAIRVAPRAPRRALRNVERWAEIYKQAAIGAALTSIIGAVGGVGLPILLPGSSIGVLIIEGMLPGLIGGLVLGVRAFGIIGVLLGPLVGLLASAALGVATSVVFGGIGWMMLASGLNLLLVGGIGLLGDIISTCAMIVGLSVAARSRRRPIRSGLLAAIIAALAVAVLTLPVIIATHSAMGARTPLKLLACMHSGARLGFISAAAGAAIGAHCGWRRRSH